MNKLKTLILSTLILSSCSNTPGTGSDSVKTKLENNEIFISSNISNLSVKSGKINVNADVTLLKDGKLIGIKNNVLGEKGQSYGVSGISSGNNGSAVFNSSIIAPDISGEIIVKVNIHDLNSGQDKVFEKTVSLK